MKEIIESQFTLETPAEKAEELTPTLKLSDEKKADVMISILEIYHSNITSWTTQCYQIVTWAVGISLAVVAYVFLNPEKSSLSARIVISAGLLTFGLMIQIFLRRTVSRAYYGNRLGISKCEAALELYQLEEYLRERPFFVYSREMLHSKNLKFITMFHLLTTLLSAFFVLFGGFLA